MTSRPLQRSTPGALKHTETPDEIFHRTWLRELVLRVLKRLESACRESGRVTRCGTPQGTMNRFAAISSRPLWKAWTLRICANSARSPASRRETLPTASSPSSAPSGGC